MIPQPITLDGRTGTVLYLDADWHPVTPEQAVMARVLFDDGGSAFYMAESATQKREYVRDEKGQFAETGEERQLQGDEEDEAEAEQTVFHGTAKGSLAKILKEGLRVTHAGKVWPTQSQRGKVYVTTDKDDAVSWAENAADRVNPDDPESVPIVILKIRIPKEHLSKLTADTHFETPGEPQRQFKGNIPPEWIIEAKIGTRSDENTWESDYKWKKVKVKKAEDQIIYVVLVLPAELVHSSAHTSGPSRIENEPGVGGLTQKWDEAKHPRGEDGRFAEATHPRIFNRLADVERYNSWGENRWQWKTKPGMLLTGEPIPSEQLPKTLYHVTTNAPAVESSGVLLGLQEMGGLGGGQAEGVSFTTSREDATVIQRELKRAVRVARGEDRIEDLDRYAREDEEMAGLPPHTLDDAVQFAKDQWEPNQQSIKHTFVWDKNLPEDQRGYVGPPPPPEEQERLRRSSMGDALKAYLQIRGHHDEQYPLLKNPIIFGQQKHLALLDPANVQILEVPSAQIPAEALVTTGSDKFLHEVRAYSDVPIIQRKKKFDESKIVREPSGTAEGGQFASTGHAGAIASDPVLAKQAQDGITAVERLLPEALRTADYAGIGVRASWADVDNDTKWKVFTRWREENLGALKNLDVSSMKSLAYFDAEKTPVDLEGLDPTSPEYIKRVEGWKTEFLADTWEGLSEYNKQALLTRYGFDTPSIKEPSHWVTGVETGSSGEDDYARTHAIAIRLTELRTDEIRKERGVLGPTEKPTYTIEPHHPMLTKYGKFVIKDAAGKVVGGSNTEEDAKQNAEAWAWQQQHQGTSVPSHELIAGIWTQWKRSSSDGLSLSLQLAAARELGGHHRMTPEEVKQAETDAKTYGGIETLQAYVRAQWEVSQTIMHKAGEDKVDVYRALMLPGDQVKTTPHAVLGKEGKPLAPPANIKSFNNVDGNPLVSFDFDNEHFVVGKERRSPKSILEIGPQSWHEVPDEQKNEVIALWQQDAAEFALGAPKTQKLFEHLGDANRFQLMQDYITKGRMTGHVVPIRPYETDEEAIARRVETYVGAYGGSNVHIMLPALQLQRAGAQSTTGTRDVANDWNGVGDLPEQAKRVVLRIEAPATSILSLPVYGENAQSEHETVLLGTKDHWLWDAWEGKAPHFKHDYPIIGKPISKKPLIEWPEAIDYDTKQMQAQKAEMKPLVIDLQAQDRGKPHWMSTVDWSNVPVVKWDESQHPRDTEGQFTEKNLGHFAQIHATTMGGARKTALAASHIMKGEPIPESEKESVTVLDGIGPHHEAAARALVDAIRHAPEHSMTLYRGLGADDPIESLEKLKVGDTVTLGLSSFTESNRIAAYYANRQTMVGETYELKTEGPIKSIPTDQYTKYEHQEHLTEGQFEVTAIDEPRTGVPVWVSGIPGVTRSFWVHHQRSITLRQVGVF